MAGKRFWLAGTAAAAVSGGIIAWIAWPDDRASHTGLTIDPDDPALVSLGQTVYAGACASCHGDNRQGQVGWRRRGPGGLFPAPPLDGSAHSWHHPDGLLFGIVRDGPAAYGPSGYRSAMPAFKGRLSDREIGAALSYIQSKWPKRARSVQAEITRRANEGAGH